MCSQACYQLAALLTNNCDIPREKADGIAAFLLRNNFQFVPPDHSIQLKPELKIPLTEAEQLEICELYRKGVPYHKLERQFDRNRKTIYTLLKKHNINLRGRTNGTNN